MRLFWQILLAEVVTSSEYCWLVPRHRLKEPIESKKDVKVKERMLLVINVVYHGKVASQVAKDIHRSRGGWVFQWLKRYEMRKIYIEGLKDKPKSGRRSRINENTEYRIDYSKARRSKGWTTKQVERLSYKRQRNKISLYSHLPYS